IEVMRRHLMEPPPPVESARPDCPASIAAAIKRMLEKDPAERWPNMDAAVEGIGVTVLGNDHPVRTQLITLARSGPQVEKVRRMSTPRSPAPAIRSSKTTRSAPPVATGSQRPYSGRVIAIGGVAALAAGVWAVLTFLNVQRPAGTSTATA